MSVLRITTYAWGPIWPHSVGWRLRVNLKKKEVLWHDLFIVRYFPWILNFAFRSLNFGFVLLLQYFAEGNVSALISEHHRKGTFHFTEILNNHAPKRGTVCQIVRFIFLGNYRYNFENIFLGNCRYNFENIFLGNYRYNFENIFLGNYRYNFENIFLGNYW